jgi:hypothetical protein
LSLYNVSCDFSHDSLTHSLTVQLNLFAGSLYLRSLTEYDELCDFLGLLRTSDVKPGEQVSADGFIEPPASKWGSEAVAGTFPARITMKIRREGEGVKKTHPGKVLNGIRLEEADFKGLCA